MSKYGTPFCSDEDLLEELGKLGYNEVSEDVFHMMKDDLSDLVEKEQNDLPQSDYDRANSPMSSKYLTSSDALIEYRTTKETSKKSDPSVSRKVKKKSQNSSSKIANDNDVDKQVSETNKYKNTRNGRKLKSSNLSVDLGNSYNDEDLSDLDISESKYDSIDGPKTVDNYSKLHNLKSDFNRNEDIKYDNTKNFSLKGSDFQSNYSSNSDRLSLKSDNSLSKFQNNTGKDSKFTSSYGKSYDQAYSLSGIRKTDNLHKNVKDAFKTFKLEKNYSESEDPLLYNYKGSDLNLNTSQSSTTSETKTIKRKVLRRRNGRSVITEEIVEIPSIFDSSYPDSENFNNSKSFSSDDLSCKSNGSTGSVTAVSPESSIKSSPSTFSLLSTRSTSLRVPNSRKKKSDPVAMYGYYRKYWDNFKPPGENTHDRLRWAVRDKMLDYNI